MELGPQNHNGYGLLGLNSIIVGYMDPLGKTLADDRVQGFGFAGSVASYLLIPTRIINCGL